MRAAPIETARGVGWVAFEGETVAYLVLPGGDRPAARAEPPEEARWFVDAVERWFEGGGRATVHQDLCEAAGRAPFEREVYRIVSSIPPGMTRTYREVAIEAGRPGAARAVGAAMARNPFAPLIPCHRVVGSDGSLRGYAGGLQMKADLLEDERA